MRISIRILCLSFAADAFIIRSAGFPSMLKTAKHSTRFAFLLV
ncbi:hypothetical protein FAEPRAM212_02504 [Faecalibacterium prausnitzii M21/2]|uniref:Uncharacterized protein n=1 Tax=Faecalibacterium prausnitzii M21/2 TaxID=411485 RepID=A8SEP2_9FIRM|nr:hypothetical protein FAEPRAM212_02504 [Faecalibacterium prausnitzii M21/2]